VIKLLLAYIQLTAAVVEFLAVSAAAIFIVNQHRSRRLKQWRRE
jgi:hypothetical protein